MVKILELYNSQPKQAFLAVDHGDACSGGGTAPDALKKCGVLRICREMKCDVGDIMEFASDEEEEREKKSQGITYRSDGIKK